MSCANCSADESPVKQVNVTYLPADFFRDLTGNQPDTVNDHTESITHNGPLTIGGITPTAGKTLTIIGDCDLQGQLDPNSIVFSDAPVGVTTAFDSAALGYYKIGVIGTQRPLVLMPITDAVAAVQTRRADGLTVITSTDTLNRRFGINLATPQAALDVSGAVIYRPVTVVDQPANITLTASTTVDVAAELEFAQNTANVTVTLPPPTLPQTGRVVWAKNLGTVAITVNTTPLSVGKIAPFIWSGTAWLDLAAGGAGSNNDFFRSGTAAALTLPDGTNDTTENIARAGNTGLGLTDPSTVAARLDVSGAEILRPVAIANKTANGAIGTAAATVDVASHLAVTQTAAGIALTLPAPTNTQAGRLLIVESVPASTQSFTVNGETVAPGKGIPFVWSGTAWIPLGSATPPADFWRSGATAATLPDGTTDTTDDIVHNGKIGIGDTTAFANATTLAAALDVSGAQVLRPVTLANFGANGSIGTAAATVDVASVINIPQTTANVSLTVPAPTNAQSGRLLIVRNTGSVAFDIGSTAGAQKVWANSSALLTWNGASWMPPKSAPYFSPIQFGGALTLQPIAHHNEILEYTGAGAVNVTVPNTLPIGFLCSFTQAGAGRITIVAGAGVTCVNRWGGDTSAGQWSKLSVEMRSGGVCIIAGDVI